jgi:hypothetical protein
MNPLVILVIVVVVVIFAIVLVIAGIKAPQASDPISDRLAEYSASDIPLTLEDLELSQGFFERIILPMFNKIGNIASRFTPQATLENARNRIEMAGNPMQLDPAFFLVLRVIVGVLFGGAIFLVYTSSGRNWLQGLGLSVLFTALGFYFPDLWLTSKI